MVAKKSNANELKITRIYDAPRKMVWAAWTEPDQVAQWWGPRGFTITTHSKDLRVGGIWSYTMHGPDGIDYPNKTLYHEVETYSRLVYDHGGNDDRPAMFRVTVVFSDLGSKTQMDMTMSFANAEVFEQSKKVIKDANGNATWDRLAEYLAVQDGHEQFVINRSFNVPLATMFEVFTKPEHLAKWMPPTGFTMEFIRADIRPGGSTFYMMSGADVKMYGSAKYLEINQPHSLSYTQEFNDADGKVSRHPFAPTWPQTMLTTVELTAESAEQTRVTITWEVHGAATREEMETFIKGRSGMTQGWTGSFDKLDDYINHLRH